MDRQRLALILSVIGLIVALYLVIEVYTNIPIACPGTGIINCGAVIHGAYSTLFGVPLADYGLVFFLLETLVIRSRNRDAFTLFSALGVAVVPFLIYLEYRTGAICLYCTTDHIIIILLLILSLMKPEADKVK